MYDTETVPVKNAPGAECVTVADGKITYSRSIFAQRPFDAAGPGDADVITSLAGRPVRRA
jgi:hypothetical protein